VENHDLITSLSVARNKIERDGLNPILFLEESALDDFAGIGCGDKPKDSVVIGLAPKFFSHEHMSRAMNVLLEGGKLVAIHKARYYKTESGLKVGPGCYVTGLEYSTGVKAEVVGKPEATFFQTALDSINDGLLIPLTREELVMVGDDVRDDVGGAQQFGCRGILVRTGKYREGDENSFAPPDAVCFSLADAAHWIVSNWV